MTDATLWIIVLGCVAATFVWRLLGALIVRFLPSGHEIFEWITCVSYAMIAGLVFRMILLPQSDLASLPMGQRILAVVIAFGAYFGFRRNLAVGVLVGGISLSLLAWLG